MWLWGEKTTLIKGYEVLYGVFGKSGFTQRMLDSKLSGLCSMIDQQLPVII